MESKPQFDENGWCWNMEQAPKDKDILGYRKYILYGKKPEGEVYHHVKVCSYSKLEPHILEKMRQVSPNYNPPQWHGFRTDGLILLQTIHKNDIQITEPECWKEIILPEIKEE